MIGDKKNQKRRISNTISTIEEEDAKRRRLSSSSDEQESKLDQSKFDRTSSECNNNNKPNKNHEGKSSLEEIDEENSFRDIQSEFLVLKSLIPSISNMESIDEVS